MFAVITRYSKLGGAGIGSLVGAYVTMWAVSNGLSPDAVFDVASKVGIDFAACPEALGAVVGAMVGTGLFPKNKDKVVSL